MSDSVMNIEVDGVKYQIDAKELSPRDAQDFRRVTGTSLLRAFDDPDIDHIAAFVWLERRRTQRKLAYSEVAEDFTLGSLRFYDPREEPDEEPDDYPEPSGGATAATSPN